MTIEQKQATPKTVSRIRETLNRIEAIKDGRVDKISSKTRDNASINVYRDNTSHVIFIDDHYVGDSEYETGYYRKEHTPHINSAGTAYEDITDSERRYNCYRQFIIAKDICDFGCGAGRFLTYAQTVSNHAYGVELQENFIDVLNNMGILCYRSIQSVPSRLDVITLFHVLEHLPDPTSVLHVLRKKLKDLGKGTLIVEVPHARDFLIQNLKCKEFIEFTLWSQHLVLHTRESLKLLLADAGFKDIVIQGVQRYSIANHFQWLSNKQPGGHKAVLSAIQTQELVESYETALARIDATDTLVAIATT